jgi:hypothetical protein
MLLEHLIVQHLKDPEKNMSSDTTMFPLPIKILTQPDLYLGMEMLHNFLGGKAKCIVTPLIGVDDEFVTLLRMVLVSQ